MTKKAWLIFGALCIAVIGGLIYLANSNKVDVSNIDATQIQAASSQNGNIAEHTYGNMNSKVVLIEYADYQCPGCGSAYPIIKQVVEKYKDKIGYVFRNFPLYSSHPNAFAAAAAAEAAGLQGKYWDMHDKLYENQSAWSSLSGSERTDQFVTLATSVGVDGDKLRNELDSPSIKKKIDFDHSIGTKISITGTPSFYINGKNVGDRYYKDDKIVTETTDGAALVWSNATAFENLVIKPALKDAGVATD